MTTQNEGTKINIESADKIINKIITDDTSGYMTIDENKFLKPDMGDYEITDMSAGLMDRISKENVDSNNPNAAAFFLESPFNTTPGFYENEGAFVIEGSPIDLGYAKDFNLIDGDTIYISKDSINDGNEAFNIGGRPYNSFRDYAKINASTEDIGIRLLGADTPEIPHYSLLYITDETLSSRYGNEGVPDIREIDADKITGSSYIYDKKSIEGKGKIRFIKDSSTGTYHQIIEENVKLTPEIRKHTSSTLLTRLESAKFIYKVVSKDDTSEKTYDDGIKARDIMLDILTKSEKTVFIISSKIHNLGPTESDKKSIGDFFLKPWSLSYESVGKGGWNAPGLDKYKRFLGSVYCYVKLPGYENPVWINVLKYIISKVDNISEKPMYDRNDQIIDEIQDSAAFKIWTYDKSGQVIADALDQLSKESMDDRSNMQKQLFGDTFDNLMQYNVMIGDNMFFIPPTSIRCNSKTLINKVSTIRSKGSIIKNSGKSQRIIELSLFFNEDRGINGYPYETTLPNGESITYYMNGLRSLISMFKFCPFQPIENDYINRVLGIEAVSLANIQLSTLPNYPGTISAVLSLQEFDYRVYMPQVSPMYEEDFEVAYENSFSRTINFPLMRWYYQRSLISGSEIKNLEFNSEEYINETFGSKTRLQPFTIGKKSNIDIYIVDKNYLDEQLQIKMQRMNSYTPVTTPMTSNIKEFGRQMGLLYDNFKTANETEYMRYLLTQVSKAGKLEKETHIKTYADKLKGTLIGGSNKTPLLTDVTYEANSLVNTDKAKINLHFDKTLISNAAEMKSFSELIKAESGVDAVKMFESGIISIDYNPNLNYLETSSVGYRLLEKLSVMAPTNSEELNKESAELDNTTTSDSDNIKDNIDVQTVNSLKFVKYLDEDMGAVNISNMSAVFGNSFTNISLQTSETYAPQYCGGQDTIIELSIQTTDNKVVTLLQNLPRLAASYVRDYRLILNCWPIRIDSEITRMLGVNEVLVDNIQTDTVPNMPGLYNIVLTLMAVDRTTRNKESLKKLDTNNFGANTVDNKTTKLGKDFFELKNALKQAETYPDLELPTVLELSKVGYQFIRYSNSTRVFPDPDFYFVYGATLFNEALRTGITKYLNDIAPESQEFDISDSYGSIITVKPKDVIGYEVTGKNDVSEAIEKHKDSITTKLPNIENQNPDINSDKYTYEDILTVISNMQVYDGWNISENIKCLFREKRFEKMLGSSENYYAQQINLRASHASQAINEILSKKIPIDKPTALMARDRGNNLSEIENKIKQFSKDFFEEGEGRVILGYLDVADPSDFAKKFGLLLLSVASGITGPSEFSSQWDAASWKPVLGSVNPNTNTYTPRCKVRNISTQDLTGSFQAATLEDAINNGIEFGMFNIKLYDRQTLINITDNENAGQGLDKTLGKTTFNDRFLDTYYREYCTVEEYNTYKEGILVDPYYAAYAFTRIVLFSLKNLLLNGTVLSLFEIIDDELLNIISDKNTTEHYNSYAKSMLHPDSYVYELTYGSGSKIKQDEVLNKLNESKARYEELCTKVKIDKANFYTVKITEDELKKDTYKLLTEDEKKEFLTLFNRIDEFKDPSSQLPKDAETSAKNALDEWNKKNEALDKKIKEAKTDTDKNLLNEEKKKLDLEKKNIDKDIETTKKAKDENKDKLEKSEKEAAADIEKIQSTIKENKNAFSIGKFIPALMLAATNYNSTLHTYINSKALDELNTLTTQAQNGTDDILSDLEDTRLFKKTLLAMIGYKLISKDTKVGEKGNYVSSLFENIIHQNINIKAADNPYMYILHSFYDMVINDKRGRMARAFPTFYMLFIDEGRDIGLWHLQDNFYNINSISEIEVTKSRKIAADSARIVMSNLFNTFTSEDEDKKLYNNYTLYDAWDSIFSPRKYALKEQYKRQNARSVEKAKLAPGVRISIRMGYDSDASQLPVVFNGSIAEVGTGEAVEIIAQGDGVELMNPLLIDSDAEDIQFEDEFVMFKASKSFATRGATPRTILSSIMSYKGGWLQKQIKEITSGRFFNTNPFGLVHFGDTDYTEIFQNGEVVQNLYEAVSTNPWNAQVKLPLSEEYSTNDTPMLSTTIFGKTLWDIMHMCASASPDYICSTAPFGLRSTVFYGHPRYYYAYDYEKTSDGVVKEKRKPFQQYHVYTSYSDIIANGIKASDRDMKTCAIGLYKSSGVAGGESTQKAGPMWIDIDIYPEKQKTMTVDTQYLAKGLLIGSFIPFVNKIYNDFKGNTGYQLAWRMTASALKESVKDMYTGEIIVIGDPTVKPYDRVFLCDTYEGIDGGVEVEAVVHNFSVDTGFITSVHPDCISAIDDRFEQPASMLAMSALSGAVVSTLVSYMMYAGFAKHGRPMVNTAYRIYKDTITPTTKSIFTAAGNKMSKKTSDAAETVIENLKNASGSDEAKEVMSNLVNKLKGNVKGTLGLSNATLSVSRLNNAASKIGTFINSFKEMESIQDIIRLTDGLGSHLEDADLQKVIDAMDNETISDSEKNKVNKAKELLKENLEQYKKIISNVEFDSSELKVFLDNCDGEESKKTIQKIIDNGGKFSSPTELKEFASALGNVNKEVDAVEAAAKRIASAHIKKIDNLSESAKFLNSIANHVDFKDVKLLKLGAKMGNAFKAIANLGLFAIQYVVSSFAYEYVERWMKNLQVLQVHPLTKHGRVLTAGLDGNRGSVAGSPTAGDPGTTQNLLISMFGSRDDSGFFSETILPIVDFLFVSDEMREIADGYKRANNAAPSEENASLGQENMINSIMKATLKDELQLNDASKAIRLKDRVKSFSSDEAKRAYKKYSIKAGDMKKVQMTTTLEDVVPLTQQKEINTLINENKLKLVHNELFNSNSSLKNIKGETVSSTDTYYADLRKFKVNMATEITTPVIFDKDIIDIPFLRQDAYNVLLSIIKRIDHEYSQNSKYYGDGKTREEMYEQHPVNIISCTRVNDKGWASTGYAFSLQLVGLNKLQNIIDPIKVDMNDIFVVQYNNDTCRIVLYPESEELIN